MDIVPKIVRTPLLFVAVMVWLYVLVPLFAPVAYVNGNPNLGKLINDFYEHFCHQRVERSIFLFSKEAPIQFYSVGELKDLNYLPDEPRKFERAIWPEYFGHDFVGDSQVGYKVPLCIRDIALYGGYALLLTILLLIKDRLLHKILSFKNLYLLALILALPMVIDGVAQTFIESIKLDFVAATYIHSIEKRIITGVLFGFGVGLATFKLFNTSSLTKSEEKGKIEV